MYGGWERERERARELGMGTGADRSELKVFGKPLGCTDKVG